MITCEECGRSTATTHSPTGRALCRDCYRLLTGLAGAGTVVADRGSSSEAVGTGLAAAGCAGSMEIETQHRARQRAKLAETTGFWARLTVRLLG